MDHLIQHGGKKMWGSKGMAWKQRQWNETIIRGVSSPSLIRVRDANNTNKPGGYFPLFNLSRQNALCSVRLRLLPGCMYACMLHVNVLSLRRLSCQINQMGREDPRMREDGEDEKFVRTTVYILLIHMQKCSISNKRETESPHSRTNNFLWGGEVWL